jgi:hypothetical protein
MRRMRVLLTAAIALSACTFDGSGTLNPGGDDGDDLAADAAGSLEVDARPPDAAPPPPVDAAQPPVDAWLACNWDFVCDPGEDPEICFDCDEGGEFVCDFDLMCEAGEHDKCIDCLGGP